MFDGMPDQFYQFLAATSRATTAATTSSATAIAASLPLSFSLHHGCTFPTTFSPQQPSFDASPYLLHHPQLPLHLQQQPSRNEVKEEAAPRPVLPSPLIQLPEPAAPWSNEEVLALLRVRSSLDNSWFPTEFTWENVSRKLAEIGFKRSAEKCKEKFEEETRSFNSSIVNNCSNKNNISHNYRLFGELEELYNSNSDNCNDNDHRQSPLPPPHDQPDDADQSLSRRNPSPNAHDEEEDDEQVHEEENVGQERVGNDQEGTRNDDNDDNNNVEDGDQQSAGDSEKTEENTKRVTRKRKRQKKFEMFKGFCEKIVEKMMAQQEELHYKILQDMVKRDQEKIAREEAWKKQEIERITKEMETRAHEQIIVGDRQAKILDFLKKFTSSESQFLGETLENLVIKVPNSNTSLSNSSSLSQDSINAQPTSSSCNTHDHNLASLVTQSFPNIPTSSSHENLALQSPQRLDNSKLMPPMSSSTSLDQSSQTPNPLTSVSISTLKPFASDHTNTNATDQVITDFKPPDTNQPGPKPIVGNVKDDPGRRWPRDEVLALINIRCTLLNNNGDSHNDRQNLTKGPLWERISQKMMELGYKRNAKRCKEKWENINKYFRKTKDLNKKRSIDSRTCPYFHQLSHFYSQGTLHGPSDHPVNLVASPENQPVPLSGAQIEANTANGATTTIHASQGNEGSVVQAPGFDYEF